MGRALLDLIKATVTSPKLPLDDADILESFGPVFFSIMKSTFSQPPLEAQQTEEQARADLRQARIAVNTYITNRWAGLIESRNRLIEISFLASIFVYILFIIAIIGKAPESSLAAGLVFYFVGVVAGLFRRLVPRMNVGGQLPQAKKQPSKTNKQSKAS